MLGFWAALMRNFESVTPLNVVLALPRSRFAILFVIFIGLMLDWIFALFVVFRRDPPSPRRELMIRVIVWVFALSFLAGTTILQFLVTINRYISSFDADLWDRVVRANYGASFALRLVTLLISAFLVFCAVCSLVVLKRSESQSKSSLQGITRLLIISSVLFASICTEFVIFCIEFGVAFGFSVLFYVPEWLDYGISKLFLHIIETCCFSCAGWLAKNLSARMNQRVSCETTCSMPVVDLTMITFHLHIKFERNELVSTQTFFCPSCQTQLKQSDFSTSA